MLFHIIPGMASCTGATATRIKAFCQQHMSEVYTVQEKQQASLG